MQKWQAFLTSISTPGGNLFVLCIFVSALLALVLHILHHGDNGQVTTVILSTFSGFSGALLQGLRGRTSDVPPPQPAPGVTTEVTTKAVSVGAAAEQPKP